MPDEYAEWRALEARVSAWEAGEGPPLSAEEEARWAELMDGWPLALEQARAAEWLLRTLPGAQRGGAMGAYLAAIERTTASAGVPLPLWIGLARERQADAA
jgi:hypothetical protein